MLDQQTISSAGKAKPVDIVLALPPTRSVNLRARPVLREALRLVFPLLNSSVLMCASNGGREASGPLIGAARTEAAARDANAEADAVLSRRARAAAPSVS